MANPSMLSKEPSSYLKSSSNQPINWYPWLEEAFEKAKKEEKPILLSIGAVWCHWCHVQAHESWENKEIAEIINKNYIAIKVDRDERPDIDFTYQNFVQMLTGNGGWPLTVFITSEKKPFFGGTYMPPETLKAILHGIIETYSGENERIKLMIEEVSDAMELSSKTKKSELEKNMIESGVANIIDQADSFNGGFGSRPKFAMPEALSFLIDYYSKTNKHEIWKFVSLTLKKMASGGVYDQLGGGFHRYSVDESWRVPHFEKMLVDNALLAKLYLKAYNISGDTFFKKIAEEVLNFLSKEISNTEFFYSSQDADTDGEEGKFFTWTKKEIMDILGEKEGRVFCSYFGVTKEGNCDIAGKNVIYVAADVEDVADSFGLKKEEAEKLIENSKKLLFKIREKREKPFTDKNTITGWNCLATSSFLYAYKVLDDERYLNVALKSLETVINKLHKDGKVFHLYSDGKAFGNGLSDDYIFFANALIEAYQITFDEKYLSRAEEVMKKALEIFWDKENGGFYFSSDREINKDKPIMDFSGPATNSIGVSVLLNLYYLTEKEEYKKLAETVLKNFHSIPSNQSVYKSSYLSALSFYFDGPKEFVVVGNKQDKAVKDFLKEINKKSGNTVIHIGDSKSNILSVFKDRPQVNGKPTVYFCHEKACSMPITEIGELKII